MHFDIKLNKSSKKRFGSHWGFFLEGTFLEILKLKNPYKIASSLLNTITFLKKDVKQLNTKVNVHLGYY